MGNTQSEEDDVERLLRKCDSISRENDIILTFVITQLITKELVRRNESNCVSFKKFAAQFNKEHLHLPTGSKVEGLSLFTTFCINENGKPDPVETDLDVIVTIHSIFAANSFEEALKLGIPFYIDTSHSYPGYARLVVTDRYKVSSPHIVSRRMGGHEVYHFSNSSIGNMTEVSS